MNIEGKKRNVVTACFTGHRPNSLPCGYDEEHPACVKLKSQLCRMIVGLIEKKNVSHFIAGAALGVDMWAMETVLELKKQCPGITLEAAVPCRSQSARWNTDSKERYERLLSLCDRVTVVQEHYTPDCMMKRNEYMVDHSDYVVAVWNGRPSGTGNTIKYALRREKPVYCISSVDFRMREIFF